MSNRITLHTYQRPQREFRMLQPGDLFQYPDVDTTFMKVTTANGPQAVALHNGAAIYVDADRDVIPVHNDVTIERIK